MYIESNNEAPSHYHCCRGRAINVTYSECVCLCSCLSYTAFKVHAPYYIVICGLSGCTICFPHYLMPGTTFGKKFIRYKMCVLISSRIFLWNVCHLRRLQRDIIINTYGYSCKVSVRLVRFECNLNFLDGFSRNRQILNFIKIRPVGAELFHEDWQTHGQRHDDANSCLPQFCERAQISPHINLCKCPLTQNC